MNRIIVQNILDFLTGVSWAVVVLGAFFFFSLFSKLGLGVALIAAFFGMIFGFILVSVFESIKIHIQNQEELQKQTLLLQEILETLNSEKLSDNGS